METNRVATKVTFIVQKLHNNHNYTDFTYNYLLILYKNLQSPRSTIKSTNAMHTRISVTTLVAQRRHNRYRLATQKFHDEVLLGRV